MEFAEYGVPGLHYKFACVRGDNIDIGNASNRTEREMFNQLGYSPPKDLRLRNSIYRSSTT